MALASKKRRSHGRFRHARITLFFLAAGVWLAGVITERPSVTFAAIVVLLTALLLRLLDRSGTERSEGGGEEDIDGSALDAEGPGGR